MKSYREQFQTVLRRQRSERLLFISRLDFWYAAAECTASLPSECQGLSIPEIEDMLGMGRSARFRGFQKIRFPKAEIRVNHQGETRTTSLEFNGRRLREISLQTEEEKQLGMMGHTVEFFLKTEDDYDLMTELWEQSAWQVDHTAFQQFDRAIGQQGLPLINLGPCPADAIMIEYAGYENFFLHLADFPQKVGRLRAIMEKRYEVLWDEILKSNAELLLHGMHWSTEMTPPSIFREHILPYMRRFSHKMLAAGKYAAFHADADLSGLLPEILESGVDATDCFACAPLVKLKLSEARRFWKDRVIIWGGLPSTIFLPSCPPEKFAQCLQQFLDEAQDGRAIMAGVSDNLMPGSLWERIKEASERIANLKIA